MMTGLRGNHAVPAVSQQQKPQPDTTADNLQETWLFSAEQHNDSLILA